MCSYSWWKEDLYVSDSICILDCNKSDEYDKYDDEFDDSDYNCGGDNDDVD